MRNWQIDSTKPSILLVDADIITYRCGFASETKWYEAKTENISREFRYRKELNEWLAELPEGAEVEVVHHKDVQPVQFALNNINTVVDALADKFPGMEMEFYLSGKDNFRKELATIQPYKGNRSEFDRPVHYDALREFLVKKYNAEIVNGQEADDAIGIRATELGDQAVIVSIDKDLDTIKGWHYNWVKGDMYYVEEKEADKNFYMQLLTGDSTDNIPGIEGIGTKKAEKILKGLSKPKGMYQAVLAAYAEAYPDGYKGHSIKKAINEIGNLLYIRKHPDEKWSSP